MTCKYAGTKMYDHVELSNGYITECEECDGDKEPGCLAPSCNLKERCGYYKEDNAPEEKPLDFKPGKLINWLISQQELSDKLNDKAAIIAGINQEQFGDLMHDDHLKESQKLFIVETLKAIDKDYYDLAEWDGVCTEYTTKYNKLRDKIKAMCI